MSLKPSVYLLAHHPLFSNRADSTSAHEDSNEQYSGDDKADHSNDNSVFFEPCMEGVKAGSGWES